MDWRNKQRQNALLRSFYMLLVMVLLVVRAGLDSRAASLPLPGSPPQDDALTAKPSPLPAAHLYPAALRLLRAAEAALRLLIAMTREAYEFMKQAPRRRARERAYPNATQCARPGQRLDTS